MTLRSSTIARGVASAFHRVAAAVSASGMAWCCIAAQPAAVGQAYAPVQGRAAPSVDALTRLGRALFFDPSLSASGLTSCASCHDPKHGYGPPNSLPVQPAGRDGKTVGVRAVPSLRYLQTLPPFSEHHFDNDGDDSIDAGPTGGHDWDGRAASVHEQARLPLLSPTEMANASPDEVVNRLRRSASAAAFEAAFGAGIWGDSRAAFDAMLMALEVFEQSPGDFYPYTSRYDAVLRGEAQLTARQARGLALFDDPAKGNCASCHPSRPTNDGAFPLFTDFGFVALGVPRHRDLPANADPAFNDLGLCGPVRADLSGRSEYCGLFRVPSLRNVAVRQVFFHNGVMRSLEDVMRFYVKRDLQPERFYGRDASGSAQAFDDLPAAYHGNINREPPFDRRPGDLPALTDAEIDDVIAFLHTLTDADLLPATAPSPPQASR